MGTLGTLLVQRPENQRVQGNIQCANTMGCGRFSRPNYMSVVDVFRMSTI
jgi:hypothetical protein